MKILLFILGFLLVIIGLHVFHQKPALELDRWSSYKMEFGKHYAREEDQYRRQIFYEKLKEIQQVNSENNEYTFGITQFSDWSQAEFELKMLTLLPTQQDAEDDFSYPNGDSIDWREKGAVSAIKDQGQCGSCWAFSAVGNLEGVNYIYKGQKMILFSEQQLVDCSWSYGNMGCNGGLMTYADMFIRDKGITTEDKYPYKGVDQQCKMETGETKISSFTEIKNCNTQKQSILKQPTSVAVDASRWSSYTGGIFSNCGASLNHGVTAVGFNDEYWIIKNSWGTRWGEKGYMRLKIGNTCGVCNMSSTAVM